MSAGRGLTRKKVRSRRGPGGNTRSQKIYFTTSTARFSGRNNTCRRRKDTERDRQGRWERRAGRGRAWLRNSREIYTLRNKGMETTLSWEDFGLLFLLWPFDGSIRNSFWRFYPEHMRTGEGSCQNLRGSSMNITWKVSPYLQPKHTPPLQRFHVESTLTLPPISILFPKAQMEPTWTYFPTELKPGMVLTQPSLGTFLSKSVQWRGKVNSPRVLSLGRARDLLAGNGFKAFWNWKRDLRARWDEMERWEGVKEVSQRRKRGRKKTDKERREGGSLRMCAEFELEIGNRMSAQDKSDYRTSTCVNTIKSTAPP